MKDDLERLKHVYRKRDGTDEFWSYRTYGNLEPQVYYNEVLFRERLYSVLRKKGFKKLEDYQNLKILEIGCGWGRNLYQFLELGIPCKQVFGVDLVAHFIEFGKKIDSNLQIQEANAAELPFDEGEFDLVFCHTALSAILEHPIHRSILEEANRVLKKGGIFIIFDILPSYKTKPVNDGGEDIEYIRSTSAKFVRNFLKIEMKELSFNKLGLNPRIRHFLFQKFRFPRLIADLFALVPFLNTHYFLALEKK